MLPRLPGVPIPEASGPEVLEYLMEEHGLQPEDLPELGEAQAVRAALVGERDLHVRETRALAAARSVPRA